MTNASTDARPITRRLCQALLALVVAYALAEGVVLVAYERVTGEAYGATRPGEGSDDVAVEAPDVRPGREQAGLGMRDAAMCLHPFFGYVYEPPAPGEQPGPVAVSPDGFLDDASPVRERDDARLLVGIVGGSVAGQLGTWHAKLLRQAILGRVDAPGGAVELVKLGMPGYHQPQQLQQLTWVLAQGGELDVLVNLDGFNEIAVPAALNAPRGTHPLFPMNWSMVALDAPDLSVRRDIGAIDYLQAERRRRGAAFEASWCSWSPIARLLWKLDDQRLERAVGRRAWSLQGFRPDEIPYFVRGPERHHELADDLIPFCVDVWKRSSLQMHALCAANGIRYLHVLQPNQYDPGSKPLSAQEEASAFEAESPYRFVVEEGYPLLRAAGQELLAAGVPFVDLSRVFAGFEDTLYVDNCCHFNALGNEILALAIADALAP